MIIAFDGKAPKIGKNVFIAPTAVVIGDVTIEEGASIWFHTILRADLAPIIIGSGTNIQDNCTLHTDPGLPLTIGNDVTVGHNAVIHGCTIEDQVLIGLQAAVLNRAIIRRGSIVAAGAVVREGEDIGPFHLVAGIPAKLKRDMKGVLNEEIISSAEAYRKMSEKYLVQTSREDQ